jgi:hypothetical protein
MNSEKRKKFDAVELMQLIREQLVRETEGLSIDDELRWWQAAELDDPTLARLAARAAQKPAPTGGRRSR